jgi:hypothetical protein
MSPNTHLKGTAIFSDSLRELDRLPALERLGGFIG